MKTLRRAYVYRGSQLVKQSDRRLGERNVTLLTLHSRARTRLLEYFTVISLPVAMILILATRARRDHCSFSAGSSILSKRNPPDVVSWSFLFSCLLEQWTIPSRAMQIQPPVPEILQREINWICRSRFRSSVTLVIRNYSLISSYNVHFILHFNLNNFKIIADAFKKVQCQVQCLILWKVQQGVIPREKISRKCRISHFPENQIWKFIKYIWI